MYMNFANFVKKTKTKKNLWKFMTLLYFMKMDVFCSNTY
jgi:hypothetical protein